MTIMKRTLPWLPLVLCLLLLPLTGCELAGDIFKAGAYTGIIVAVLLVVLVLWLLRRFRR
ncbi:hypothetical protein D3Y59_12065 [Hymenobacter oligotrophus]|uniref:Phosphatidate cytidylyltransferase n=2 Tax=Hymenobacter oligotrophus TaxID=2319843 RepID=A0A3B7REN1_9BACT|nr:hypothetical protein D3Y59_12065 [Hymenobacter oligotrophus]